MGSKGSTTQQTSSTSGPPPQVMAEYQSLVDRATNVANQPYQPYQGEMVAPLSSQTLSGLGGVNQYANSAQPYLEGAGAMTLGASQGVNPAQYQGMGSLAPFMNPYTSSVVGTTEAEMQNQNQQQAQFLNSANISSGAFGGDRAGIGQSILANQQQLAEAPTIAGLNQANYTQAMQNWQQQQGVNLAAGQWNQNQGMTGAAQLGQIGNAVQQAGLQGAQTQIQAGTIPQQEQQAIDQAAQQQYATSQAYPFTTTGWLGNIIEGTGSLSGGTSQTTSPGPNSITQGLGLAQSGIGIMGSLLGLSDERAKENIEEIGKTYDDQPIYRYNFRGDPRTQIGLLAQEEAYHDPGSVQRIGMGDLLGIDYESATDEAAERGHFQYGGAPSMGSAQLMGAMAGGGGGGGGGGSASPGTELMYMGDPGARMGLGSLALASGAQMHPQPSTAMSGMRPQGPQQSARMLQPAGRGAPIAAGLPSLWTGGRAGFQSGGNTQQIYAEYGLDPSGDVPSTWEPGQMVAPNAGEAAANWDIQSGGKYTGVDLNQTTAIGEGQWMTPATTNLTPSGPGLTPNWQDLGSTPQYGAAEASLAGLFPAGYTPGQVPGYQQPSSSTTPTQGTQPSAQTSPFSLADAENEAQGILSAEGQWGISGASGSGRGGVNNQAALDAQAQMVPALMRANNAMFGNQGGGGPRGDSPMFGMNNAPGGMQSIAPTKAMGGRIGRAMGGPMDTMLNAEGLQASSEMAAENQSGHFGGGPSSGAGNMMSAVINARGQEQAQGMLGSEPQGQTSAGGMPNSVLSAIAGGPGSPAQQALAAQRAGGTGMFAPGGTGMFRRGGRIGFQAGGDAGYYTPTTGVGRGAGTWHAPVIPPVIAMRRMMQARAQAGDAVDRALTRHAIAGPRSVVPQPVVARPPLHDRPPFGTGPYSDPSQLHGPLLAPRPAPAPPIVQPPVEPVPRVNPVTGETLPPERMPSAITVKRALTPAPPPAEPPPERPIQEPRPPVEEPRAPPPEEQAPPRRAPPEVLPEETAPPAEEPPLDESWKSAPYGGHSTNYGPPPEAAAPAAPPEETAPPADDPRLGTSVEPTPPERLPVAPPAAEPPPEAPAPAPPPEAPLPMTPPHAVGHPEGGLFGPHLAIPQGGDEGGAPFESETDMPGVFHPGGGGFQSEAYGGRVGFQDGGAPMVDDPRYSYYTPTTGNARGATYHPPTATVSPIALAPAFRAATTPRSRPVARAQAPADPPEVMDPQILARQKTMGTAPGQNMGPFPAGQTWPGPVDALPGRVPYAATAGRNDQLDYPDLQFNDQQPAEIGSVMWRGGRAGYQGGGDVDTSYGPQQPVSDMSDEQFARAVQDEARGWTPSDWNDVGDITRGMPSDADWQATGPPSRQPAQRITLDPQAVQRTPTFRGSWDPQGVGYAASQRLGGNQPGYRGVVTNYMGGPPITAGDFSGMFGGGGGGVDPRAQAQAPEHPAITIARRIHNAGYMAGHAAGRRAAAPRVSRVDPNMGPFIPTGPIDPSIIARQKMNPYLNSPSGTILPPSVGVTDTTGAWTGGRIGRQGGGGLMGSSPIGNAGGYTPQGMGMSGQTSQGEGLGSFATSSRAAGGFGDLFGGGRQSFAEGGGSGIDPFLAAIESSVPSGGGGGGHGPPQPPPAPQQPQGGGGPQIPKDLGQNLKQIGQGAQNLLGGGQNTPTSGPAYDQAFAQDVQSGVASTAAQDLPGFGLDTGFATGGGVGLGSLRRPFLADGGGPPPPPAPAPLPTPAPVDDTPAAGPPTATTGYIVPAKGGGSSTAPNLSYFSNPGYAGTISKLESGSGKTYVGDDGSSFGPFQLHMGGISEKYPHPGLGDEFQRETGLDPRDPRTVDAQSKFVADYTAKHGWGSWSTKGQADRIAGGADVPAAGAMPASATTQGYGGGFSIPPGWPQQQPQPQQSRPPTMGDELRRDPFGYMMTVGAAMAASRSPWLGVGIGEGLEAGNKYLTGMQSAEREWGVNQAQIQNLSAEAREHGLDADMKANQLQAYQMFLQHYIDSKRGTAPGATGGPGAPPAPVAPVGPVGPSGAPSGAPTASVPPSGGPGPGAPSGAPGGAPRTAGAAPAETAAPSLEDQPTYKQAMDLYAKAQDAELDDKVFGTHTAEDMRAQAGELMKAATTQYEKSAAPYTAKVDAQKAGYQKFQENAQEFEGDYESNTQMLTQLGKIYQHFQSGAGAKDISELQGFASRFGLNVAQGWDKAGYDAALKTAVDAAFEKMKSSGAGKAPRTALQEALLTSPTPTNDPAANWKIITETLARLHYAKDMNDDILAGDQLNTAKATSDWAAKHSLDPYRTEARKNTPLFMGMTPKTYAQVTGAGGQMERGPHGEWRDPESGKMWDARGNPVN